MTNELKLNTMLAAVMKILDDDYSGVLNAMPDDVKMWWSREKEIEEKVRKAMLAKARQRKREDLRQLQELIKTYEIVLTDDMEENIAAMKKDLGMV